MLNRTLCDGCMTRPSRSQFWCHVRSSPPPLVMFLELKRQPAENFVCEVTDTVPSTVLPMFFWFSEFTVGVVVVAGVNELSGVNMLSGGLVVAVPAHTCETTLLLPVVRKSQKLTASEIERYLPSSATTP